MLNRHAVWYGYNAAQCVGSTRMRVSVEITLVRFEITVVSVVITLVRVKITIYVEITLCVYKSQNHTRACCYHTRECHIHTHTCQNYSCVSGNHTR
jgi:hypothetical protein